MDELIKDGKMILVEDGIEKEYTVLFTFYNERYNKNYVVYTDDTNDKEGNLNIFASWYDDASKGLEGIESDDEWAIIDQMVYKVIAEVKNEGEK